MFIQEETTLTNGVRFFEINKIFDCFEHLGFNLNFIKVMMSGHDVPYTMSDVSSDAEMSRDPSSLKLHDHT